MNRFDIFSGVSVGFCFFLTQGYSGPKKKKKKNDVSRLVLNVYEILLKKCRVVAENACGRVKTRAGESDKAVWSLKINSENRPRCDIIFPF